MCVRVHYFMGKTSMIERLKQHKIQVTISCPPFCAISTCAVLYTCVYAADSENSIVRLSLSAIYILATVFITVSILYRHT